MMDTGASRDGSPVTPGLFLALAELGLLAAAFGTAAGFSRLFVGWSFLGSLAVPLLACWASSLLLRRLRVPVWISALVSTATAVVVLTWRFAPGTAAVGLPTGATVDLLRDRMQSSFGGFSRLVAPVEATDGFVMSLAAVMWVFGFFADTAAFRFRGPVQAVIPYASTFVAGGILARDAGRTGAVLCFLAGLGTYALTQRVLQASTRRWVKGEAARGSWAVAASGAALVVVAVLAGVLFGPRLPGDTEAVMDLRALGQGGGSRTVVSPFVGVRSLLGEQSDQILFTVDSPQAAYWRLTSLEQYDADRDIWVSRGTYRRVTQDLASPAVDGPATTELVQRVHIQGLGGLWLPAAFQPVRVSGKPKISYDQGSASVIVRDASLAVDATFEVTSALPGPTSQDLAGTAAPDQVDPVYLQDPELSPEVRDQALAVTRDAPTPYLQALALQNWFRSGFAYDTSVDFRDAEDPLLAFLEARAGFCQQFSSTFALMARAIGLPARVAVGFTPGDAVNLASEPGARPGFVVRGRHAHAWPEVYLNGAGWVPFEPTPGRGNPQATSYTQVPAEQAEPPAEQAATTTSPPTTGTAAPVDVGDRAEVDAVAEPETASESSDGRGSGPWVWPAVFVALGLLVVAAVRIGVPRHRRRRLRSDPRGGRIAASWVDSLRWLAMIGIQPSHAETPMEFAARAGHAVGKEEDIAALAWVETIRRFDSADPTEAQCEQAERSAVAVQEHVRSLATRRQQARHLIS